MHHYEEAIGLAHANGFVHHEALAYELAGRFYAARRFDRIADTYLRAARCCYVYWGAPPAKFVNSTAHIPICGRKRQLATRQARSGHPWSNWIWRR
jgi:hypothetical protein